MNMLIALNALLDIQLHIAIISPDTASLIRGDVHGVFIFVPAFVLVNG